MSNFRGWILDAFAKESAAAINAPINIQYVPVNRRELRSLDSFKSKYLPKTDGNNLFFHHRTFLEVNKRVSLQESRNRIRTVSKSEIESVALKLFENYISKL